MELAQIVYLLLVHLWLISFILFLFVTNSNITNREFIKYSFLIQRMNILPFLFQQLIKCSFEKVLKGLTIFFPPRKKTAGSVLNLSTVPL